jgi:hypothetical protein
MNLNHPEERAIRVIRRLIWVYFWLLILEGALRKWIFPQISNPLLVIRDPVVLAIFLFSFRARVFPTNAWTVVLIVIGVLTTIATFIQLWPYFPLKSLVMVTGYGIHANFFHLPLIFVMAKVLRFEDVKRIGWWTLLLIIPMSLLMIAQFRAAPDAFLNHTAGGEGEMMMSALGKVRTAGPFTFVIGVVAYFALASAFLLWGVLKLGVYENWLMAAAGIALVIGIAVSGSRSVVGACGVVFASLLVVFIFRRDALNRVGQALMVAVVLGFIVSRTPVFREGVNVLFTRFNEVAEATEQSVARGLIARMFSGFGEVAFVMDKAPFFGFGLGIGTNAGANILTGHSMFLLTEGEWSRVVLESGPLLGLAYIFWRVAFAFRILWECIKSLKLGNLLPFFLLSATFLPMLNGQFGQPTVLGFTVFVMGLTLAALKDEKAATVAAPPPRGPQMGKRVIRRSVYAERLHGPPAGNGQTNGSADR